MQMPKKILFVIKSPPYGSLRAAEGFRIATAMVAMDILPQLLFIDDGVYCLIKSQNPEAGELSSFHERLKTIADLIGVSASLDSVCQRELKLGNLNERFKVKMLSRDETGQLFSHSEAVITF